MVFIKPPLSALALLGVLFLAPAGLRGDGSAPLAQVFRSPKLGASRQVEGATLSVGHAKMSFTGTWGPLECGGRTVGMFLEGKGEVDYVSAFRYEASVFAGNVKSWSALKTRPEVAGTEITIPFSSAKVFWAGPALPDWGGQPGSALGGAWEAFQREFTAGIEEFAVPQDLTLQGGNQPQAPWAVLELAGGTGKWLYRFDGADRMEETLDWLQLVDAGNGGTLLAREPLSRQPVGWDPLRDLAPVWFQIQDLDFDLRTKDNRNAEVVARELIYPAVGGLEVLRFALMTNLFTKRDTRHLTVTRVTDESGTPLSFDQSGDYLLVRLEARTQAGKAFRLTFEYRGDFLYCPGEDNYWELGVGQEWYPSLPGSPSENFTFHGTVRTLGDWISFLPGDTVRKGKDGEWNIMETRTTNPICWPAILAGKYFVDEETREGVTVRIATYGFKPGSSKTVLKDQAFAVIQYYQPFLGPFPFKEFSIIQKTELGYGQAPAGMLFITREAFMQVMYHEQLQREMKARADINESYGRPVLDTPNALQKTMDVRKVFSHAPGHEPPCFTGGSRPGQTAGKEQQKRAARPFS